MVHYRVTEPVTSSECERTHCKVAQVKSAVRCSMTDDRWEHLVILVLVKVEQNIIGSLDLASLVDIFKMQGGERRVKL